MASRLRVKGTISGGGLALIISFLGTIGVGPPALVALLTFGAGEGVCLSV